MVLTKLVLDPRHPAVRQDLHNCQDMHRSLMHIFGEERHKAKVLYRVRLTDSGAAVYLFSDKEPAFPPLAGMFLAGSRDMEPFFNSVSAGKRYSFDLLAAPCKKVAVEGVKNSRRRLLRTEEERLAWLRERGEKCGFSILWVREGGQERKWGSHAQAEGGSMVINAVHYCGTLKVEDPGAFRKACSSGIGPGKAYGLGMLLLASE